MIVCTLAQRPDCKDQLLSINDGLPEFMQHDPTADLFFHHIDDVAEFVLVAVDEDEPDVVLGFGHSAPFIRGRDAAGAPRPLSDEGWDAVIRSHAESRRSGAPPDAVSALEIRLRSRVTGRGLSTQMVTAMRDNARRLGFTELVAPVRPTAKHLEPRTQMSDYAWRRRPDGLPSDPWMRVHARLGATIAKVAPRSMVIAGSLAQWRDWTGLPFDRSGEVVVAGALVPVLVSVEQDCAVYIEPNVWMVHPL